MNTIEKPATPNTPEVKFIEGKKLVLKGRSIPQDAKSFYQPLIDWAAKLNIRHLAVDINLEFMNSTSAKKLLNMLKKFDSNNRIETVSITWYYEEGDEECLISGQIFEKLLKKPVFNFQEYKE
ncbi:MAG: DUF1987 domain-containing protein [Bacteroidales bacterium]|nr:DUF1987 domain-containing protein [Bacteroidales bacterium]